MQNSIYIVATPIGNLSDISQRACETLNSVDLILAEDTRTSKKLLQYLGIRKPMMAVHEHNETAIIPKILTLLETKNLALISDAGTPLINDPGFKLVQTLKQNNMNVIPIPGACALIAALSASGLATHSFGFYGFLPTTSQKRLTQLDALKNNNQTLIFYESPKRISKTLKAMLQIFGEQRICCVAREITKRHEQIVTENLQTLNILLDDKKITLKGEFVVIVAPNNVKQSEDETELDRILGILSQSLSRKESVQVASEITGINKNKIYQKSLKNLYFKKQNII